MRPVCAYTDFFVLATGQNPRQTKAIWDEVHEKLKKEDRAIPTTVEGATEATLDPGRLPRRRPARLHARRAPLLPPRGAVGRRADADARSGCLNRTRPSRGPGYGREHELTTDQKGAIAETAIAHAAAKLCIPVYAPVSEGGRYDLIFDVDIELFASSANGRCGTATSSMIRCRSCRRIAYGLVHRSYTTDEIDLIAGVLRRTRPVLRRPVREFFRRALDPSAPRADARTTSDRAFSGPEISSSSGYTGRVLGP